MSNDPDKELLNGAPWAPPDPTTRVGGDDNDKDQGKSVREAERDATKEGGNNSSRLAGEGFKSSVGKSGENKKIKFLTTRKKFFLAALAFGASAGVAAIIVFLPSIMFKTISEKLQQAFYDKADYALDQRMEKYVNQYIVDRYANVDGRCGTNVTKGCAFTPNSSTLYGYVAQTWQDNRIEEKLFQKYGIEFEKDLTDPTGQRIKVFKTNDYGVRGEVGTFGERQVLSEVKDLFKKETKAREIITRRHVRGILTGKFGAKYCLVACERRDELADSRISATNKLKLRLAARISEHLDARKTAYLLCMVSQCNTEGLERLNKELADEIISRADSELLEELAEELSSGRSRDLSEAIVKRFVEKAVLQITKEQTTARAAASGVPIAGQIYLGATLLEAVVALDEKVANGELSKYLYDMNIEASTNYAKQIRHSFSFPFFCFGWNHYGSGGKLYH